MKHIKKFLAVLSLLLLVPALSAKSKERKDFDPSRKEALASGVVYRGVALGLLADDNFRVVIPRVLYRSNLLKPKVLSKHIKQVGLKTVINLMGKHPEKEWWQQEAQVCGAHGVQL